MIVKRPDESIPVTFDFADRLGALAPGAAITAVEALSVDPAGTAGDLEVGDVGDAVIDQVGQLAVQVVATGGRAWVKYRPVCRATVQHSGGEYLFEVELDVRVI
jgi:hypothetical protein